MEHYNPLLKHNHSPKKFFAIGEIMLRLTPPNYEKIRMATNFEASYGGSEANIALSLANLGVDSTFFSVVPNNSLGKSAVRMLRSNDVHCTPVILSTPEEPPSHRLGTYYLETGYGIRPSKVIYDRQHSAFTEYDFGSVDVDALPSMYVMPTAAAKTASRHLCGMKDIPLKASCLLFIFSTALAAAMHLPAD